MGETRSRKRNKSGSTSTSPKSSRITKKQKQVESGAGEVQLIENGETAVVKDLAVAKSSDIGNNNHFLPESSSKVEHLAASDERSKEAESSEKKTEENNVESANVKELNSAKVTNSTPEVQKKLSLDFECNREVKPDHEVKKIKHFDIRKDESNVFAQDITKTDHSSVYDEKKSKELESPELQKGEHNTESKNVKKLDSADADDGNLGVEKKLNLVNECNQDAEEIKLDHEVEEITKSQIIQNQIVEETDELPKINETMKTESEQKGNLDSSNESNKETGHGIIEQARSAACAVLGYLLPSRWTS